LLSFGKLIAVTLCIGARPAQIGLIVGVVIAFILIIAIVVVVVIVIIRRRRQRQTSPMPMRHEDPDEDHPDVERRDTLFPKQSSKPIPFVLFHEHVATLEKDTNLEYNKEFEVQFPQHNVTYSFNTV